MNSAFRIPHSALGRRGRDGAGGGGRGWHLHRSRRAWRGRHDFGAEGGDDAGGSGRWDVPRARAPRRGSGLAINLLVHGTTIATNALLERTGARVVLVTTGGFEDLLWLRRQDRAALYDLARDHPPPLVARRDGVPVAERMGDRERGV